jgi:transposase
VSQSGISRFLHHINLTFKKKRTRSRTRSPRRRCNVSTHKVGGVEEAIEARGARPIFLPAYSPDLNPIEQLFARLKSFLRKMKARTVEQLWRAIASFLKGVSKEECKAYLANSGYT